MQRSLQAPLHRVMPLSAKLFVTALSVFIFLGCSQNIDHVNITARHPSQNTFYFFVSDGEHQGGSAQGSYSASTILNAEALGGNFTRTNSSSASFMMTSGIGVD